MIVKIIFNNDVINSAFVNGWGFSCLVDDRILFDTGEKAEYLFNNMEKMKINIPAIEAVVISHDHWDHTGGLWELLKKREKIKVYACFGFSKEFKDKVAKLGGKLIEVDRFVNITENIYVTGEIIGRYNTGFIAEQALVVKTKTGINVITGCSHPGIIRIIEKVKEELSQEKIHFVFGGFHLMDKDKREVKLIADKLKDMGIDRVGPTHCSGYDAQMIFKERYGDNFIFIKAGQVLEI